jgi:hypothetical protein
MTSAEWINGIDPELMLRYARDKGSDRKLRLYLCARGQQIKHLLKDKRSWQAVEVAERYADGLASPNELAAAHAAACEAARMQTGLPNMDENQIDAASAAWEAAHSASSEIHDEWTISRKSILVPSVIQCALLRDIFFLLPFHAVNLLPSSLTWNSDTAPKLAQAIYEEYAFDRLPILADALEEAGCTDGHIVSHCRNPGLHVKGCWVVDLILGKN